MCNCGKSSTTTQQRVAQQNSQNAYQHRVQQINSPNPVITQQQQRVVAQNRTIKQQNRRTR
jgi:hypothetical protein